MTTAPQSLLTEFACHGSEEAFRELVRRYSGLVYSAALRQVDGDHHSAEDIAQTVFTDLAVQLRQGRGPLAAESVQLGGWLHHHTCLVAANHRRATQRRNTRELAAAHGQISDATSEARDDWAELEPVLDQALDVLPAQDRAALVLRYLERQPLRELGLFLGIGEDAAQKRVSRALDRLRAELLRRGVTISAGALALLIDDRTTIAAPPGLEGRMMERVAETVRKLGTSGTSPARISSPTGSKWAGFSTLLRSSPVYLSAALVVMMVLVGAVATRWPRNDAALPPAPVVNHGREAPIAEPGPGIAGAGTPETVAPAASPGISSKVLRLTLVSARDGRPIPNALVRVNAMVAERSRSSSHVSDGLGSIEVRYPDTTDRLMVITRTEQFADLLLSWPAFPDQLIPEAYQVRLEDGVSVGGEVVTQSGDPILNARVHFQAELGGNRGTGVEQFVCLVMPVTTDVTGRWLIKGVPEWLLDGLHGTATMADGGLMTTRSVAGDPRVRAELREGTFRFVMETGGVVAGQVVDPSATPIAGAAVSILAAPNFGGPSTLTAADGTFRFENRVSGTNLVTVQADGWAPRTVVAVVAPRPVPIRVVLAPGLPIRWRVTDSGGAPLEGVSVRLDSVPPDLGRRATDASITRAEFATRTDADGRAAWNHAPDEDLTFVFGEFGEWGVQRRVLRPSEEDHVIRLSRALVTSGTVVDANEGSPVHRFRVSRMSRLRDPSTGEWVPAADPHTPAREFVEGKFRQAWTHDDPSGTLGNEGFFLLVEADGYEPVISRWISSQEGHARLDLSLRTIGTSKTWLVRAPDGTPAGHAEVVTVDLRQVPALLAPDGIGGMLRDRMVRTEGDGTVLMSVDTSSVSEKVFLAYHREGVALASVSEVARSGVVALRAWSRIEGRLRNRNGARSGATLELEGASDGPDRLQPLLERFATVTDSEGRFEFPRVPPGRLRLSIRDKARPTSMSDGDSLDVPIETEPGKTVSLEIGADHRPIRLRLAEPAILVLMASVGEGGEGAAAERSSELRGEGHGPRITLGQTGRGVWSTPSAPPGRYRLAVLPGEVMTPTTARELKLVGEITVPPSPTGEVFDAGEFRIPAAGEE